MTRLEAIKLLRKGELLVSPLIAGNEKYCGNDHYFTCSLRRLKNGSVRAFFKTHLEWHGYYVNNITIKQIHKFIKKFFNRS